MHHIARESVNIKKNIKREYQKGISKQSPYGTSTQRRPITLFNTSGYLHNASTFSVIIRFRGLSTFDSFLFQTKKKRSFLSKLRWSSIQVYNSIYSSCSMLIKLRWWQIVKYSTEQTETESFFSSFTFKSSQLDNKHFKIVKIPAH